MRYHCRRFVGASFALLAISAHGQTQVYKCVDSKTGSIQFADVPCDAGPGARAVVRTSSPAEQAADDSRRAARLQVTERPSASGLRSGSTNTDSNARQSRDLDACEQARHWLDERVQQNAFNHDKRPKPVRDAQKAVQGACDQDAIDMTPEDPRSRTRSKWSSAQQPCFWQGSDMVNCGGRGYFVSGNPDRSRNLSCTLNGGFANCY